MTQFKSLNDHARDVKHLQKLLTSHFQQGSLSLGTSNSHTLRNAEYKKSANALDLERLSSLIAIDKEARTVTLEPKVTMRDLVTATLDYNLIPPVVPEFKSITVGGAINGAALETTSHQYGQFNDTCLEYELLLANGTLLKASADNHPDLFYGVSGSYGTLAIITLITLKLIPASKGVHLNFSRFESPKELILAMRDLLKKEKRPSIIEGGVLAPNWAVLITGQYVDIFKSGITFHQKKYWDPWYHQQMTEVTKNHLHAECDMPLQDYLFRFDRAAFWMGRFLLSPSTILQVICKWKLPKMLSKIGRNAAKLTPTSHPSFLFRLLFGWALSSKRLYKVWHQVPREISENFFFIHDFYTPASKALEAYTYLNEKTGIFPIWLCPIRPTQTPQILAPHHSKSKEFLINIGVYGIPSSPHSIPSLTASSEQAIFDFGGKKMLYSHCYFSPELFSKTYNLPRYEALCKKYFSSKVFIPIYNKVTNK